MENYIHSPGKVAELNLRQSEQGSREITRMRDYLGRVGGGVGKLGRVAHSDVVDCVDGRVFDKLGEDVFGKEARRTGNHDGLLATFARGDIGMEEVRDRGWLRLVCPIYLSHADSLLDLAGHHAQLVSVKKINEPESDIEEVPDTRL